ncbi:hypothetical protein NCAST_20_00800 [Nocardia asteroides NBRC 15531]|uniref:Uncharacterized protein n=2 Tax=Nocardia asteroides TaxID=1824 RepID=U5EE78_NOCAS|nr:hypothetical protein NCAST_20_00800 [Nocardia asteroides NBRC 15531]
MAENFGMGISVFVQDQVHGRVRMCDGRVADTLSGMVLGAGAGTMLGEIHAYADTMFNCYQLTLFLDELARTPTGDEREAEVVAVLREAAEEAIERNGYLWFSGD